MISSFQLISPGIKFRHFGRHFFDKKDFIFCSFLTIFCPIRQFAVRQIDTESIRHTWINASFGNKFLSTCIGVCILWTRYTKKHIHEASASRFQKILDSWMYETLHIKYSQKSCLHTLFRFKALIYLNMYICTTRKNVTSKLPTSLHPTSQNIQHPTLQSEESAGVHRKRKRWRKILFYPERSKAWPTLNFRWAFLVR